MDGIQSTPVYLDMEPLKVMIFIARGCLAHHTQACVAIFVFRLTGRAAPGLGAPNLSFFHWLTTWTGKAGQLRKCERQAEAAKTPGDLSCMA